MPRIKSFRGIRPNPKYVDQVVLQLENLSIDKAKEIREENPFSYVNMLVPKLDNRFMRGSKKELAYKQINENFESFLEKEVFIKDNDPSLYIYRVAHRGITQTGIWTVTSIDDYLNNKIKKHELTLASREAGLIEYLQQTGIDSNPVLITYPPDTTISEIIKATTQKPADSYFTFGGQEHWLWQIKKKEQINVLIQAFADLPASYIADGHHRAAAACSAGIQSRKWNLKHTGNEEYNFFTSVYIASDQLKIYEFNRLVKDLGSLSEDEFIAKIQANFELYPLKKGCNPNPSKAHHFGMYLNKQWFRLIAKEHIYKTEHPVAKLDVSILQKYILSSVLNIEDPRTDPRIAFSGGIVPIEEVVEVVNDGAYRIAFTLFPTSIDELIRVADAGEVMPPKSTWFEPKFLSGLLIHLID